MDKLKQRIKIAQTLGWTQVHLFSNSFEDSKLYGIIPNADEFDSQGANERFYEVPDYLNDLNAIHKAVESLRSLPGPEWFDFGKHLYDICGSTSNAINATAEQKSEAFLKAIRKWEE